MQLMRVEKVLMSKEKINSTLQNKQKIYLYKWETLQQN